MIILHGVKQLYIPVTKVLIRDHLRVVSAIKSILLWWSGRCFCGGLVDAFVEVWSDKSDESDKSDGSDVSDVSDVSDGVGWVGRVRRVRRGDGSAERGLEEGEIYYRY